MSFSSFFFNFNNLEKIVLINHGDIYVPDNTLESSEIRLHFMNQPFAMRQVGQVEDLLAADAHLYRTNLIEHDSLFLGNSESLKVIHNENKILSIIIKHILPSLVNEVRGYQNNINPLSRLINPSSRLTITDEDNLAQEFADIEDIDSYMENYTISQVVPSSISLNSTFLNNGTYLITENGVYTSNYGSPIGGDARLEKKDHQMGFEFKYTIEELNNLVKKEVLDVLSRTYQSSDEPQVQKSLMARRESLRRELSNSDFHLFGLEFKRLSRSSYFVSMPLPKFALSLGISAIPYNNVRVGNDIRIDEADNLFLSSPQAKFFGLHPFVNDFNYGDNYDGICMNSMASHADTPEKFAQLFVNYLKLAKNTLMTGFHDDSRLNPYHRSPDIALSNFFKLRPKFWCKARGFEITNT